jgi:ubiquinone/menaquinone biosynthesis C-methylase UbiE
VDLVLENTEKGILVEAGCGTGEVSVGVAKKRGDSLVLIDISARALALAQMNAQRNHVSVTTLKGDVTNLSSMEIPRSNATAFNIGVIEHFEDCSVVLREMAKVSGTHAFAVIPEKSLFWRSFVRMSFVLGLVPNDFMIKLYDETELRDLVTRAGFPVLGLSRTRILGVVPYLGIKFCHVDARNTEELHEGA